MPSHRRVIAIGERESESESTPRRFFLIGGINVHTNLGGDTARYFPAGYWLAFAR